MADHHHHHQPVQLTNATRAFKIGIALNFLFVLIEASFGFYTHSLSLLSDAGHNLADVGTLALSLLAFSLLKVKSNDQYTYGYRKTSILVALFNSFLLLATVAGIFYEAVQRMIHPEPLPGMTIAIVAVAGILVNGITALLFLREKDHDLNIKSAYIHLLGDAAVSAAIVVGGAIIYYTGWYWIDSIFSVIIAVVILISTWDILKGSLRLSLDGVPEDIVMEDVRATVLKITGVKSIHHVHVWAISTTENAFTAHIVLSANTTPQQEQEIKHQLKHALGHKNIQHITLETEREGERCESGSCEVVAESHSHAH